MFRNVFLFAAMCVIAVLFPLKAVAEPITFERAANVPGRVGVELTIDSIYSYEQVLLSFRIDTFGYAGFFCAWGLRHLRKNLLWLMES